MYLSTQVCLQVTRNKIESNNILGTLRIITNQVFHHRAKLEAHSIEAHGLDLKMEQVKLNHCLLFIYCRKKQDIKTNS